MIYLLIYIIIGIIHFGFCFAWWQRHYPTQAEKNYYDDFGMSLLCSIFWLANIPNIISEYKTFFSYGVKFW